MLQKLIDNEWQDFNWISVTTDATECDYVDTPYSVRFTQSTAVVGTEYYRIYGPETVMRNETVDPITVTVTEQ